MKTFILIPLLVVLSHGQELELFGKAKPEVCLGCADVFEFLGEVVKDVKHVSKSEFKLHVDFVCKTLTSKGSHKYKEVCTFVKKNRDYILNYLRKEGKIDNKETCHTFFRCEFDEATTPRATTYRPRPTTDDHRTSRNPWRTTGGPHYTSRSPWRTTGGHDYTSGRPWGTTERSSGRTGYTSRSPWRTDRPGYSSGRPWGTTERSGPSGRPAYTTDRPRHHSGAPWGTTGRSGHSGRPSWTTDRPRHHSGGPGTTELSGHSGHPSWTTKDYSHGGRPVWSTDRPRHHTGAPWGTSGRPHHVTTDRPVSGTSIQPAAPWRTTRRRITTRGPWRPTRRWSNQTRGPWRPTSSNAPGSSGRPFNHQPTTPAPKVNTERFSTSRPRASTQSSFIYKILGI